MAGGMTYTAVESTALSTAEYYGKTLVELGAEHPEVVALTADLGKSTKIGMFGEAYPDRFFNVGIAEQNMFGVAAGMARAGLVPFLSTFSVFASLRSADQLHTDICYQNVNAKIIATHSGTSFGQAGSTHHAICDLAVTRAMPNLTVICPQTVWRLSTQSVRHMRPPARSISESTEASTASSIRTPITASSSARQSLLKRAPTSPLSLAAPAHSRLSRRLTSLRIQTVLRSEFLICTPSSPSTARLSSRLLWRPAA